MNIEIGSILQINCFMSLVTVKFICSLINALFQQWSK